jgi:hypothetical protein
VKKVLLRADGKFFGWESVHAAMKQSFASRPSTFGMIQAGKLLDPYLKAKPYTMRAPDSLVCPTCEFFNGEKCCGRKSRQD